MKLTRDKTNFTKLLTRSSSPRIKLTSSKNNLIMKEEKVLLIKIELDNSKQYSIKNRKSWMMPKTNS